MLAIARALMSRPKLLLLDEPSLGLAPLVVRQIFAAIAELNKRDGVDRAPGRAERASRAAPRPSRLCDAERQDRAGGGGPRLLANREVRAAYLRRMIALTLPRARLLPKAEPHPTERTMMRMLRWAMVAAMLPAMAAMVRWRGPTTSRSRRVGPITGPYAAIGEQMKRGAELAVEGHQRQGRRPRQATGADRRRRCLRPETGAQPSPTSSRTRAWCSSTGIICSGSSIPASSVYADSGILQISPASTNPTYTDDAGKKGWINVFRICGRDDQQGKVAGDYLAAHFKGKPVAHHRRQIDLWQRPRRRDAQGAQRRRREGGDGRIGQCRRQGFLGAGQQDETGRHRRPISMAAITPRPG